MKNALITGITGQDGSYLAELLLEKEKIEEDEFEAIFSVEKKTDEAEESVETEETRNDNE